MAQYKQKCSQCKKQWVLMRSGRSRFAVCLECEMKEVVQPVEEKKFVPMFDLPLDWYRENHFLRSVRYQYGRFGALSEKQIEAFKKTVKEMKALKKTTKKRVLH